jgi:hypothetical protein
MVDDITVIRSMYTEAINHEPGITFIQTGQEQPGRPCIGSWIAYGLGSMNRDLPTFVVMNVKQSHPKANTQAISAKLWSAGFLSPEYAGVGLRAGADPVLYLSDPEGVSRDVRRRMLDGLSKLNQIQHEKIGSPETLVRISQYEMAFRMQSSVPEMPIFPASPRAPSRGGATKPGSPARFRTRRSWHGGSSSAASGSSRSITAGGTSISSRRRCFPPKGKARGRLRWEALANSRFDSRAVHFREDEDERPETEREQRNVGEKERIIRPVKGPEQILVEKAGQASDEKDGSP